MRDRDQRIHADALRRHWRSNQVRRFKRHAIIFAASIARVHRRHFGVSSLCEDRAAAPAGAGAFGALAAVDRSLVEANLIV